MKRRLGLTAGDTGGGEGGDSGEGGGAGHEELIVPTDPSTYVSKRQTEPLPTNISIP